jgi:hypothetical protein
MDDERGVSPVVGFVLIFALIMIVFTMYQAEVVPAQNEEVEFEHSQVVGGQMQQLRSAVIDTSSTGQPRSVTLDTGVQYPSRALAINPGNPIGTLETVATEGVTVSGIDTEYGNGTYTFDTSLIAYRPNYLHLSEETEYVIENGMLVKDYSSSDTVALESAGPLFSANRTRVNLILVGGTLEERQMTTTVTMEHVDTRTIHSSVLSNGTITLPTMLPESQWNGVLNGTEHSIRAYDDSGAISRVTISLGSGTDIELSTVVPSGSDFTAETDTKRYIENKTSLTPAVAENTTEYLTVNVHDQFGSPIGADITIEASETGAGRLNTTNVTPNADGEATFAYKSNGSDAGSTVTVTVDLKNGSENGPVTFELNYPKEDTTANESSREPLSVATGSLQSGPTDLIFRMTPGAPVNVTGFSLRTKGDLENLNETGNTHEFHIYTTKYVRNRPNSASGLHYASAEPIQFDGEDYTFNDGPRMVASSEVHLKKFDSADGITFTGFVDSYEMADLVVYFVLEDGTKRPVYLTGTMNG